MEKMKPLKMSDNFRLSQSLSFLMNEEINIFLKKKCFNLVTDEHVVNVVNDCSVSDTKSRTHCVDLSRNLILFVQLSTQDSTN